MTMSVQKISGLENAAELLAMLKNGGTLVLGRLEFSMFLNRYIHDSLSIKEITEISEILEMNDRISYPTSSDPILNDLIFYIANPEINEPITKERAQEMINLLHGSDM